MKLFLTTELICLYKHNSESMITARFLTCEEMIAQLFNDIRPGGPKTIISVLFSLSWRKLFDNHFFISEIHSNYG